MALPGTRSVRRESPAPGARRRRAPSPCARRAGQRNARSRTSPRATCSLSMTSSSRRCNSRRNSEPQLWASGLVCALMRHRQALVEWCGLSSRAIALGTCSGGWGRSGLLAFRCDSPAACSGVVERGLPPRAAASRDRESARPAYALSDGVRTPSWVLEPFPPSTGVAPKEEG